MILLPPLIKASWPAPSHVHSFMTTRQGGYSVDSYAGFNVSDYVGDDKNTVIQNRTLLRQIVPNEPKWLTQVHGTDVLILPNDQREDSQADAAVTREKNTVLAVQTADCLPILLCDRAGSVVAAIHAGWRGLCHGIIENTILAMACSPQDIYAWLGPAIGPAAFEVGVDVRAAFIAEDPAANLAFVPAHGPGKWFGNLYLLATQRLTRAKVAFISGGEHCTYSEPASFFSYRRDKVCGRMASLIWLT